MSATGADVDGAALKKVFPKLVEGLEVVNVIDELYANDLLSSEEYEGILHACMQPSSTGDSRNVNRRMLMAIRRRPPGFVAKLVVILRKKYSSLANTLEMGEWCCNELWSLWCGDPCHPHTVHKYSECCLVPSSCSPR